MNNSFFDLFIGSAGNQNPNVRQSFFVAVKIEKRRGQADLFSFQIKSTTKDFGWHLVFSNWFLVIGRSNEKNIKHVLAVNEVIVGNKTEDLSDPTRF